MSSLFLFRGGGGKSNQHVKKGYFVIDTANYYTHGVKKGEKASYSLLGRVVFGEGWYTRVRVEETLATMNSFGRNELLQARPQIPLPPFVERVRFRLPRGGESTPADKFTFLTWLGLTMERPRPI